jgi:hypothetical protein
VDDTLPFPLPPIEAVLRRTRPQALSAFTALGWRPWATPIGLDAERRRALNVDLTEPEVAFHAAGEVAAVAHVEIDRAGQVTLLELTAASAVRPEALAAAVFAAPGEPRLSGGGDAREWVWGPEAGSGGALGGEPVRLWVCAERAYGDRLWAVASLVRRG